MSLTFRFSHKFSVYIAPTIKICAAKHTIMEANPD